MERVAGLAGFQRTMSKVVEMFREAAAPKGRNRFSCPLPAWDLLWELGQAFGWHPKGTTYVVPARSRMEAPARRNYQPGSVQDHKQVEAEDATVDLAGVGSADISATGSVKATIAGAGNITLHRRPTNLQTDISGVGSIDHDYPGGE